VGETYRERNPAVIRGTTNAGFASASQSFERFRRHTADSELDIGYPFRSGRIALEDGEEICQRATTRVAPLY
jgi:hypothetical protein